MSHPSHHFAPGDERCFLCGGIKNTSETDGLCKGRMYDDAQDERHGRCAAGAGGMIALGVLALSIAAIFALMLATFWNMPPPQAAYYGYGGSPVTEEDQVRSQQPIPPGHDLVKAAEAFGRGQRERQKVMSW